MNFNHYHCTGCGLIFQIDLHPSEILFCPICAGGRGTLELVSDCKAGECANCGCFIWQDDATGCSTCAAMLCDSCYRLSARCTGCEEQHPLKQMDSASGTIQ